MTFYILILFLLLLNLKVKSKLLMYVCIIFITLHSSFRVGVGTDYNSYYNLYFKDSSNIEFIYSFFYEISRYFDNPQIFFIITSVIFSCAVIILLKVNEKYQHELLFVLYASGLYFVSLNQIRQSISIVFFLIAVKYLINKDALKYYVVASIAIVFHSSAIFLLIIYPIISILRNYSPSLVTIILLSLMLLRPVFLNSEQILVSIIPKLAHYFDVYSEISALSLLLLFVVTVITILSYYYIIWEDEQFKIYFLVFVLGMAIRFITYPTLGRLASPLVYCRILLFGYILSNFEYIKIRLSNIRIKLFFRPILVIFLVLSCLISIMLNVHDILGIGV